MEDQMTPRVKHSVLIDLINLARKRHPDAKEKIKQWQIEDMLFILYREAKADHQQEQILSFAANNGMMLSEPLAEEK